MNHNPEIVELLLHKGADPFFEMHKSELGINLSFPSAYSLIENEPGNSQIQSLINLTRVQKVSMIKEENSDSSYSSSSSNSSSSDDD